MMLRSEANGLLDKLEVAVRRDVRDPNIVTSTAVTDARRAIADALAGPLPARAAQAAQ